LKFYVQSVQSSCIFFFLLWNIEKRKFHVKMPKSLRENRSSHVFIIGWIRNSKKFCTVQSREDMKILRTFFEFASILVRRGRYITYKVGTKFHRNLSNCRHIPKFHFYPSSEIKECMKIFYNQLILEMFDNDMEKYCAF
jgi:hypothetical protein